jgi:hypothetical protein
MTDDGQEMAGLGKQKKDKKIYDYADTYFFAAGNTLHLKQEISATDNIFHIIFGWYCGSQFWKTICKVHHPP